MNIKKDDNVLVITGQYAGKQGKVLATSPKDGTVLVEGINIHKKAHKARKATEVSGFVDLPGPIDVSNVMVVCPSCDKATRVRIVGEKKEKHRVCVKCGAVIDKAAAKTTKAAKNAKKEEPAKRVRKERGASKKKDAANVPQDGDNAE